MKNKGRRLACLFFIGCYLAAPARDIYFDQKANVRDFTARCFPGPGKQNLRLDLEALFRAYPGECLGVRIAGHVALIMKNGAPVIYDDGRDKSFPEKLAAADLQDMLEQVYVPGTPGMQPGRDFDPGRIRCTRFFQNLYGRSAPEVLRHCVKVALGEETVRVTGKFGVADHVRAIHAEMKKMLSARNDLRAYVFPLGGSFNWRTIAGTSRLSPHSFGFALDLNSTLGLYWRWARDVDISAKRREYPKELLALFESHFFIWGGKWDHFDLMHYEFRPELFIKQKILGSCREQGRSETEG